MTQLLSNTYERIVGDTATSTTNKPNVRSGQMMRALAWYGKHDVRMIDTEVPTITEPQDAVLRITGTTVCGSDLHLYNNEIMQLQQGEILGHEFCGVVDEVGPACHLKVGQRVVASFQIACGTCEYCKKGLSSMCDTTNNSTLQNNLYGHRFAGLFGYSHFAGGFAGGQAEYVRIPFADTNLLPLPDDVPDEKGLYLSDIIPTSYHACHEASIEEGDTVGIWGLGPIGLCCTYWAKVMGAGRVIAIDNVKERLDKAKELGAETINFGEIDTIEAIQKMVPGGLDRTIDCAGFRYAKSFGQKLQRMVGLETDTSDIVNEQIKAVRKFGTIVLIADYAAMTNGFNIGAVMEKGIRLIGGGQAPVQKYWDFLLDNYVRTGLLDPLYKTILTHRFQIEDIPKIYKHFDAKEYGIIKTFVETKFSAPANAISPPLGSFEKM